MVHDVVVDVVADMMMPNMDMTALSFRRDSFGAIRRRFRIGRRRLGLSRGRLRGCRRLLGARSRCRRALRRRASLRGGVGRPLRLIAAAHHQRKGKYRPR
jgi:hypothetical protein